MQTLTDRLIATVNVVMGTANATERRYFPGRYVLNARAAIRHFNAMLRQTYTAEQLAIAAAAPCVTHARHRARLMHLCQASTARAYIDMQTAREMRTSLDAYIYHQTPRTALAARALRDKITAKYHHGNTPINEWLANRRLHEIARAMLGNRSYSRAEIHIRPFRAYDLPDAYQLSSDTNRRIASYWHTFPQYSQTADIYYGCRAVRMQYRLVMLELNDIRSVVWRSVVRTYALALPARWETIEYHIDGHLVRIWRGYRIDRRQCRLIPAVVTAAYIDDDWLYDIRDAHGAAYDPRNPYDYMFAAHRRIVRRTTSRRGSLRAA